MMYGKCALNCYIGHDLRSSLLSVAFNGCDEDAVCGLLLSAKIYRSGIVITLAYHSDGLNLGTAFVQSLFK